jgi:lipopolysaccharide export system protein LptA
VTAYPKDADSLCLLTHDEDRIDCSLVELSLVDCKAKLHAPKGRHISSLTPNLPKGDLRFHSKFLIWDAQNNTLTLKEDVELDESTFGNLKTDQEILLTQKEQNGKRIISSIKTTGKTHLEYKTPKGLNQRLTCFGNIVIDRQQHHAHAESPVVKGKVDEKEQIIFENDDTLIYADKAFLEYALTDDVLEPASLDLKGNVRLTTRDANQSLRCACADRLNYSPNTQTLTLSANRGKKVLFWNEEQLLRISAQEVHITRDPLTKKESVKGIGNVRFAFTLEEHHLLNKVFPKFMIGP